MCACDVYCLCCFFFFKQKTAYEMRISDWSSDVCSSDLYASRWSRRHKPRNPEMTNATSKRIGFIGLGNQGAPLAMQLVKAGLDVTVWEQRAEAMEPFISAGPKAAKAAADLGARFDFVAIRSAHPRAGHECVNNLS